MDHYNFIQDIHNCFDFIGKDVLAYDRDDYLTHELHFQYIERYAMKRQLKNTIIALHVVRGVLFNKNQLFQLKQDGIAPGIYLNHCINVTNMLIDLHTQLDYETEDIMLASSLFHVLLEKVEFKEKLHTFFDKLQLDTRVLDIIYLNLSQDNYKNKETYFNTIQQDRIALLVKLADRGNILEQLYEVSIYDALEYIRETKQYYLPMCIYGKEHYHELYRVFGVLMEKIKCLVDTSEILSNKHLVKMNELNNEILALKEENARIRLIIKQLKEKKALES